MLFLLIKISKQVHGEYVVLVQFVSMTSLDSIHGFLTSGILNEKITTKKIRKNYAKTILYTCIYMYVTYKNGEFSTFHFW